MNDRSIDPVILLHELNELWDKRPDFDDCSSGYDEQMRWFGKTHALIKHWSPEEAANFRYAWDHLGGGPVANSTPLYTVLHAVIGEIELRVRDSTLSSQVFGPGCVYDVHQALGGLFETSEQTVMIVDPYLNDSIFEEYLSRISEKIAVRLLFNKDKSAASLPAAYKKYSVQYPQRNIIMKSSCKLHDRVFFVDDLSCWVLGQSIKDAATKDRPTYLAPLSDDIVSLQREYYEDIWDHADPC